MCLERTTKSQIIGKMTYEEIDNLQAGEHLDSLLAELMEAKPVKNIAEMRNGQFSPKAYWIFVTDRNSSTNCPFISYFKPAIKPSTDIKDAFFIANKLAKVKNGRQAGHPLSVSSQFWKNNWLACFGSCQSEALTPEVAICRAILKAFWNDTPIRKKIHKIINRN